MVKKESSEEGGSTNLFVGNLSRNVTYEEICGMFESIGNC